MKFWYALNKNITSQPGRFVYEVGGTSRPEECLPEVERNEVLGTCTGELADLQTELTADLDTDQLIALGNSNPATLRQMLTENPTLIDQLIDEQDKFRINVGPQVVLLMNLSQEEAAGDSYNYRGAQWLESLGDRLGVTNNNAPAFFSNFSDTALMRFAQNYQTQSFGYFTDQSGENTYTANFYENGTLNDQMNFNTLLSSGPENAYILMGGYYYARTPRGYICFSPNDEHVGDRAAVKTGTPFEIIPAGGLNNEVSEDFATAQRQNENLFTDLESTDPEVLALLAEQETNFRANFATAQEWKNFTASVASNPILANSSVKFIQDTLNLFIEGGAFRQFLDADFALASGDGDSTAIPFVLSSNLTLSATSSPSEFREGIQAAMVLVREDMRRRVQQYQVVLKSETDPTSRAAKIAQLQELENLFPEIIRSLREFPQQALEGSASMLNANSQLLFQAYGNEVLTEDRVQAIMQEFDQTFYELVSNRELNRDNFRPHFRATIANILGPSVEAEDIRLEDHPELQEYLEARFITLMQQSSQEYMQLLLNLQERETYLNRVVQVLGQSNPNINLSIDPRNATDEDIQTLLSQVEQVYNSLQMRKNNDPDFSAEDQALLDFLTVAQGQIPLTQQAINSYHNRRGQIIEAETAAPDIAIHINETFDASTEEGRMADQTVSIAIAYAREQAETNGGELPMVTAQQTERINQLVERGVPIQDIHTALRQDQENTEQLLSDSNYESIQPEQQLILTQNLNTIPYNVNLVGLTPNGQFILESPGTDETRYLQNPTDGTIIAEHLTGVPDSEDLRVPPKEWATAQALGAMTEGFVVKSAAELAQAGETLGNRALVNFMRQYWGIRGRDTLPESELDQFKSFGEMMSNNHINLHTVLHQLDATKWDETAAGNRATDVRYQFDEILAAAAAGNNAGFRELLRLDELSNDKLETGP